MPHRHTPEARLVDAAVTDLQATFLGTENVESILQETVDRATLHVSPSAVCTLTALVREEYVCVASSDEAALQADLVEYAAEAGPCVEAVRHGTENVVTDLRTDGRWPEWAQASWALGFRSAAGVPADTGDGAKLALDLYSREPDAFGDEEMHRARLYAEEAARTLRLCLALAEQATLTEHLHSALSSRSTIDQALGVIMGRNKVPRDEAFAILRSASQDRNVKLREVAEKVIENLTGHPPADPPTFVRHRR